MLHLALAGLLALGAAAGAEPPTAKSAEPAIRVEFHGRLRHGVAAIGGETTGTTISLDGLTWELNLPDDAARTFADTNHKKTVTAIGSLRQVRGTEVPVRWIVDVEKLEARDKAVQHKGIDLTVNGTLRSKDVAAGAPISLLIESKGITWPLEFCAKSPLQAKGEMLIGKPVVISGSLERDAAATSPSQPIIRVKKLDLPAAESKPM